MKIFLIWLGIVGCGVANGFLFSDFGFPENLVFVFCSSIVCAVILLIHRRITKDWKKPLDPWTEGFRFPVFGLTLFFSVFGLIMLFVLKEANATAIVTCSTIAIVSFVAYRRECNYTGDWV